MQYDFQFAQAMQHAGIIYHGSITADGKIHRIDGKRKGDKSSWYVFNGDYGAFGDWRLGIRETWIANSTTLSPQEKKVLLAKIEAVRKRGGVEIEKRYAEAAKQALAIWNKARAVTYHPYLQQKQVEALGIRQYGKCLLIPLYNVQGNLCSLQVINLDVTPSKKFLPGGRKKGCFHFISSTPGFSPENPMCHRSWLGRPAGLPSFFVVEGYATGASVHMATGLPVVVAFDAGNLEPVIAELRKVYPDSRITIAADNDQWGEVNTGILKAEAAARKHSCKVVWPEFSETMLNRDSRPTDWNDRFILERLGE